MKQGFKPRHWFRRFGVQLSLFFLGTGLAVVLLLGGTL